MGDHQLNRYLLPILALMIIAIFAFDQAGPMGNKHFVNGEISFDYPANWNQSNGTGMMVASFIDTSGLNVTINKRSIPDGYDFNQRYPLSGIGTVDKNFQVTSTSNISVNGLNGYEVNYKWNSAEGEKGRKEVVFEKNNMLYNLIFTGKKSDLSASATSGITATMVKSFKVNDTNPNPSKPTGWAELQMPTLKMAWNITTTSVDVSGAVCHIKNSYFPGEKGELALLGHHTTRHAPFRSINTLKVGDPLIVKDYVTGKKYTYQVTSNGNDVRWGVEGEDIQYKASEEPQLWLITCYPPGYSKAAWIVHSRLVSVEPLN